MYGANVSTGAQLSTSERWLVRALWAHAVLSGQWIALAWRDGIAEDADLRFVVNTTGKDGLFVTMSVVAARNAALRLPLVLLLIAAYGCLIVGQLFELLFADPAKVRTWPSDTEARRYLGVWMGGDIVLIALFSFLYREVSNSRR